MSANKVKYGLKNVHYALVTETVATDGTGAITSSYGSLKALAGAVSLSMSSSASKWRSVSRKVSISICSRKRIRQRTRFTRPGIT